MEVLKFYTYSAEIALVMLVIFTISVLIIKKLDQVAEKSKQNTRTGILVLCRISEIAMILITTAISIQAILIIAMLMAKTIW